MNSNGIGVWGCCERYIRLIRYNIFCLTVKIVYQDNVNYFTKKATNFGEITVKQKPLEW